MAAACCKGMFVMQISSPHGIDVCGGLVGYGGGCGWSGGDVGSVDQTVGQLHEFGHLQSVGIR